MTALNWSNSDLKSDPSARQWKADIFRTNAEGTVTIEEVDNGFKAKAVVNGHHYENPYRYPAPFMPSDIRRLVGQWVDRLIEQQQEDANA